MNATNEIFFSYAWGDENEPGESREKIVNALYNSMKEDGYLVVRDKYDLHYKGYISDFMKRIGEGKNIVVVISKKYLHSPYCMFELYEIARNAAFDKTKFKDRVFPIIIDFIDFSKPAILKEYLDYWENEFNKWDILIKDRSSSLSAEQFQRYDKIKMVKQYFGKLADWLIDMNTLNPNMLSKDNFAIVKKVIEDSNAASYLLPKEEYRLTEKVTAPPKTGIGIIVSILLSILLLILAFIFIKNTSKKPSPQIQSVSVFVHGKKGRQDMILRNQGHVIMDLKGGERKRADINENGIAYFPNLRIGDSVRLEVDFSEPYKSIYADSMFVVTNDGQFYLPVALQGIEKVKGVVLYNDKPLAGVTVSIGKLEAITSQTGQYEIDIPEAEQKKQYTVWFNKVGFKAKSAPSYPQTGEDLNVVLDK